MKIVIIGAGITGLTCAHILKENHKNLEILIIESQGEIGGRIKALKINESDKIELGATEITNTQIENARKIFKSFKDLRPFHRSMLNYVYSLHKRQALPEDSDSLFSHEENEFIKSFEENVENELNKRPKSDTYISDVFKSDSKISEDSQSLIKSVFFSDWNTDIRNIHIKQWKYLEEFDIEEEISYVAKMGGSLLDHLEEMFVEEKKSVCFNTRVKSIENKNGRFYIQAVDSKSDKLELSQIEADFVIVTCSVNVIKSLTFIPELQTEVKGAIDKIMMNKLGKLIMKFNKRFWQSDAVWINSHGKFKMHYNHSDDTLVSFVDYQTFEEVEKLYELYLESDTQPLERYISNAFQESFFLDFCPIPYFVYFHNWTNDENFLGGYTFPSCSEETRRIPIDSEIYNNKLFFAGEAFPRDARYIACIAGSLRSAYETCLKLDKLLI